jgi:signal transduction histidine kinase
MGPPPACTALVSDRSGRVRPADASGLLPQVRQVEGVASVSLLGADFRGQMPGAPNTWSQHWRSVAWFWAHLLGGAVAGCAIIAGGVLCTRLVGAAPVGVVVLGTVGVVLAVLGLCLACAQVLIGLAPVLLGPSKPELLAALEARAADLVERTRLARELHDGVGHALSTIVIQAAVSRRRLDDDRDAVADSLTTMQGLARRALEDLDEVLALLRQEDDALTRQPVHDLRSLDGLIQASRLDVRLDDPSTLPDVVSREAYRIIQEGLTNALRHAPDQPVRVELARTGRELRIEVSNPLTAVDRRRRRSGGRGLSGVRERARILGGRADAGPHDGLWRVDVTLPAPARKRR